MRSLSHRGFTLVELLLTLAIIGALAAITIPVVGVARNAARRAVTTSNLRQVGMALLAYAHEHGGALPLSTHSGPDSGSWINTLRPYLDNIDEVRACALDPRHDEIVRLRLSSFTLNEWMLPDVGAFGGINWRYSRLDAIRDPSRAFLLFLNREQDVPSLSADHTHSTRWDRWSRVIADIDPDRFRDASAPRAPDRSSGASPYLFADAHVSVLPAALVRQRFDLAVNISEPGRW